MQIRSNISLKISLFIALYSAAIAAIGWFIVSEGLVTGRVHSLGAILGSGKMVYRDTSPEEYWTIIGICIFGGLAGIAIGIQQSFEVINGYKKKIAAQKEMKQLDKRHDS